MLSKQSSNKIHAGPNMSGENYGATVAERCAFLMGDVAMEFNGAPEKCRMVLATAKYLVTSAVFPAYALKGEERMTIFNLLCGRNWRSREKHLFRYVGGVHKRWEDRTEFTSHGELIAVEGLFISLSSEEPTWKWSAKKAVCHNWSFYPP